MEQKTLTVMSIQGKNASHDELPSSLSPAKYDESEQWVQEYKEQFGTEPSFF